MIVFSIYSTIFIFLLIAFATAVCVVSYFMYKHKATAWLALYTVGLICFVLNDLGKLIMDVANGPSLIPGPMYLLWISLGSVILVIAFSRFLLQVFCVTPRPGVRILLAVGAAIMTLLSAICLVTGWNDVSMIPALAEELRGSFLFVFAVASILSVLIFQSRLPDRALYKTFLVQLGSHLILFPLIAAEATGLVKIGAFHNLGTLLLICVASVSVIFHVGASFMRPKYVEGSVLSSGFTERFKLSERERDVVMGVFESLTNGEIAEKLFISVRTVENHLYRIYQKVGIKNRLQLYKLLQSDSR